jgi:hypothetical protein
MQYVRHICWFCNDVSGLGCSPVAGCMVTPGDMHWIQSCSGYKLLYVLHPSGTLSTVAAPFRAFSQHNMPTRTALRPCTVNYLIITAVLQHERFYNRSSTSTAAQHQHHKTAGTTMILVSTGPISVKPHQHNTTRVCNCVLYQV